MAIVSLSQYDGRAWRSSATSAGAAIAPDAIYANAADSATPSAISARSSYRNPALRAGATVLIKLPNREAGRRFPVPLRLMDLEPQPA